MRREAMRKVGSEEKAERIMDRADREVKKIEVITVPHFGSRFSRVRPELNRFKTNKEYIEPRTGSAVRSR
jgi:hypothetical protein